MRLIPKPEKLPPLIIGVKTSRYRKDDRSAGSTNPEFKDIKPEIFARDHNTCGFCGVQTRRDEASIGGGLEVHHINDNHNDHRGQNLISICPLCHAVFHFGHAARKMKKTIKLGYLPWIRQEDLNILTWTLAIASHRKKEIAQSSNDDDRSAIEIALKAEELFWAIKTVGILPDNLFGEEITKLLVEDPASLATALAGLAYEHPAAYEQRAQVIGGIRIVFDPERLGEIVPKFSEAPLWFPGKTWAASWHAVA